MQKFLAQLAIPVENLLEQLKHIKKRGKKNKKVKNNYDKNNNNNKISKDKNNKKVLGYFNSHRHI